MWDHTKDRLSPWHLDCPTPNFFADFFLTFVQRISLNLSLAFPSTSAKNGRVVAMASMKWPHSSGEHKPASYASSLTLTQPPSGSCDSHDNRFRGKFVQLIGPSNVFLACFLEGNSRELGCLYWPVHRRPITFLGNMAVTVRHIDFLPDSSFHHCSLVALFILFLHRVS